MIRIPNYSLGEMLLGFILSITAYTLSTIIYRIYFHPLSHIPGPKLAASTNLYRTYYRYAKSGPLHLQIDKLHEEYGSVVRIAPNEVVLNDAENYDKIYSVHTEYTKDAGMYEASGVKYSGFGTLSNEVHRIRRAAMSPMFSKKMILELEHVVQSKAKKLMDKVQVALESGKDIDLFLGFRAAAIDIITDFAYDKCYNLLDTPDLGESFLEKIQNSITALWIFQQWPIIRKIIFSVPPSLLKRINPGVKVVFELREHCTDLCREMKDKMDNDLVKADSRPNMLHRMFTPGIVPGYVVPTPEQLSDEAYTVFGAAADTTGGTLLIAAYNILNNPAIYKRLNAELKEAFPDSTTQLNLLTLEKLPYLTAVVKEGLRYGYTVPGPLPRVVPESGAEFNGYKLPKGSVVGMGLWTLHRDQKYFESPDTFNPERWLASPGKVRHMEKAFAPFSRGSRMCVGMQLAYSELYVILGMLFRRFDNLKCNVLTKEDLWMYDYIAAYYSSNTKLNVSAREE